MIFDSHSLTESLEFSESESNTGSATVTSSFEEDNAYLITNIHYAAKLKHDDVEMFKFEFPVLLKIVDVEYRPVKYTFNLTGNSHQTIERDITEGNWQERTMHKFNPYIYKIELQYGPFTWTIFRRYNDFLTIHEKIILRIAAMKIPIPTKRASARRHSFKEETKLQSIKAGRKTRTLPPFPKRPEIFVTKEDIEERKNQLEAYLQGVLKYKVLHISDELKKFFEVSIVSFVSCLGIKRKEGIISKRCGGRLVFTGCLEFFNSLTYQWSSRWFFVKDTFVAYIKTNESRIGDVLLMDNEFKIGFGKANTGSKNGLIISNKNRKLFCVCQTTNHMIEWVKAITSVMESTGQDFIQIHKHLSFAPFRPETFCKWFIDGDRYMNAISNSLEYAKEEIYIAGWWLSPQIHMKRPTNDNYWRLDHILLRKAEEGVLIFILLFKEIEMMMNINSRYTKIFLSKLHPNIQVLRHPDHISRRILFWSHHEKMVLIDQKICYLGGIDLCFGRWDTPKHSIHDVVQEGLPRTSFISDEDLDLFLNNRRQLQQTIHVPSLKTSFIAKHSLKDKGTTFFSSMKRKSLQRPRYNSTLFIRDHISPNNNNSKQNDTNFIESLNERTSKNLIKYTMKDFPKKNRLRKKWWIKKKFLNNNNSITSFNDNKIYVKTLFAGKDYVNWIIKDCVEVDKPDNDLIDRETTPRMPWHDIGCAIYGRSARDAARHFIQRWNSVKKEKSNKNSKYNILVPKGYAHSEIQRLTVMNAHQCTCQVLRSVSMWSANISSTENSILNAYIETIRKAKHYIYIENQFFISATSVKPEVIKNQIGKEIFNRIVHHHRRSTLFRVYILLPLLPAFESDIITNKTSALHAVLHYNYRSLFRGNDSLFVNLNKLGINPKQYIFLGSLRNYGLIGETLTTEQIYIHSKLMIVDDLYVIIGSANLNDRSMLGYRDSEFAVWFKDEHLMESKFNNCNVKVGNFASSLRKSLMAEHLGLNRTDSNEKAFFDMNLLDDPVGESFFVTVWCSTAKQNTELFDEIFACFPSNNYTKFAEFSNARNKALLQIDPELAKRKVLLIQGHLVVYPTECLIQECLEPSFVSKEGFVPSELWV